MHFSLGGFTALVSAAGLKDQITGVVLLNSAGQFGNGSNETINQPEESVIQKLFLKPLKEIFQRVVLGIVFWQAKQPARIQSVLKSVCVYCRAICVPSFLFLFIQVTSYFLIPGLYK